MRPLALPFLLVSLAPLVAAGCDGDGDLAPGFEDRQIVVDFADQVVVPTYQLLATRLTALDAATAELAATPDEARLSAARAAWIAARQPWEQSEGFLFGPVDALGYDPALDSWPVNRTDLDAVLASGAPFTPAFIEGLQETQKGFHTVEYLLFGDGGTRTAASLGARELAYLTAISGELATIGGDLAASWTTGVSGLPPYRDVLVTAGEAGNTAYPSLTAAVQELLDGMIGICDEVANGKIADPYDAHDPELVESQFSYNSLADFQDNLRSVQNTYLGAVPLAGTSGRGLTAYVADLDPTLDARLRAEIDAAIAAIAAIPGPFRDAITTPSAYASIEAAQTAVRRVQTTLEQDVSPLVLR